MSDANVERDYFGNVVLSEEAPPMPDSPTLRTAADALAPARRGGRRHLTFDNGRSEDYDSVFVQHQSGEWDRILIARDDGTIAQLLADLINAAAATPPAADTPTLDAAWAAAEAAPSKSPEPR